MKLNMFDQAFTICKLKDLSGVRWEDPFCFLGKTDEEISLVCDSGSVPDNCLERDDGWRAFRVEGVLDFSLIGILSKISGILASHAIGIFVVSTYNTDYVLVKEEQAEAAKWALKAEGYEFI